MHRWFLDPTFGRGYPTDLLAWYDEQGFVGAWDPAAVDAELRIIDTPGLPPAIALEPDRVLAVGDWTALEAANSDRRYSLFGNLGFVFRYAIHALERHHDTWSFHASAMVDDKGDLWLIPGGAGAGKTVFLLEGLTRGWTIFFGILSIVAGIVLLFSPLYVVVLWWILGTYRRRRREYPERLAAHLRLHAVRLRSPADADRWLAELQRGADR